MGYILYNVEKDYMFEMARNKKIKIIWKDYNFFGIIDFKDNTKGNIICELTADATNGDTIEGDIITLNLKTLYTFLNLLYIKTKMFIAIWIIFI